MHPTLELIQQRYESNSLPLHRTDDARLALVLEGGSSRAAYGGGMVGVLEDYGLVDVFDAVYGTSAGALNAAWFVCQRANANMFGWWEPESMKSIINFCNVLARKPIVDGDYLIDYVYQNITHMGFDDIIASDVEYHAIATDADTGENVDLHPFITDVPSLKKAMKATARIPVLSGQPVELAGRRFIDGGMTENVPVETALADGATHVLVIRTKVPSIELPATNKYKQRVVTRWMEKHTPGSAHTWELRNRRKQEIEILMHESSDRVLQVAPPADAPKISMVNSNTQTLKRAVDIGKTTMQAALAPLNLDQRSRR